MTVLLSPAENNVEVDDSEAEQDVEGMYTAAEV
jgi:hypothetical protein